MKLNELKTILMSTSNYRIYKNGEFAENYYNCFQEHEEEILNKYGEYIIVFVRADIGYDTDYNLIPILEIYLED